MHWIQERDGRVSDKLAPTTNPYCGWRVSYPTTRTSTHLLLVKRLTEQPVCLAFNSILCQKQLLQQVVPDIIAQLLLDHFYPHVFCLCFYGVNSPVTITFLFSSSTVESTEGKVHPPRAPCSAPPMGGQILHERPGRRSTLQRSRTNLARSDVSVVLSFLQTSSSKCWSLRMGHQITFPRREGWCFTVFHGQFALRKTPRSVTTWPLELLHHDQLITSLGWTKWQSQSHAPTIS